MRSWPWTRSPATDNNAGPSRVLLAARELPAVIGNLAREATSPAAGTSLSSGARAAEFTTWLHRDAESPARIAVRFRAPAAEWAVLTGDGPIRDCVLLGRPRAADRHDPARVLGPARMLGPARAPAHGPWTLQPRARAETVQQEARALVLTGERERGTATEGVPEPETAVGTRTTRPFAIHVSNG
ncbi:hypothetical protein ACFV30_22805 [Streptomyces sp. NPDC059752]|uniref:hypothetical protein n=1 Tax=unclassified Streptomyces TaxID=2593676 RepID=UPI0036490317